MWTRRAVAWLLGISLLAAACGGADDERADAPSREGWTFTDDRLEVVALEHRPERVVVYEALLPALWELGVRPIGVLASMPLADNPDVAAAAERLGIDLDDVAALSHAYGEVDLEAMARLRPELVVTYFNQRTPVLYGFADESMQDTASELAPVVALDIHNDVPTDLARVVEVADALGADTGSDELRTARDAFDGASERLRSLAAANPDLQVLAAVPLPDGIFVAAPSIYPFAAYLADLGFDVVVPADDSATVSWELVPTTLAADAVLLTAGPDYPTHDGLLAEHPTWRSHPAAAAGQVASAFPNVTVPSYATMARLLETVADALDGFRSLD